MLNEKPHRRLIWDTETEHYGKNEDNDKKKVSSSEMCSYAENSHLLNKLLTDDRFIVSAILKQKCQTFVGSCF